MTRKKRSQRETQTARVDHLSGSVFFPNAETRGVQFISTE